MLFWTFTVPNTFKRPRVVEMAYLTSRSINICPSCMTAQSEASHDRNHLMHLIPSKMCLWEEKRRKKGGGGGERRKNKIYHYRQDYKHWFTPHEKKHTAQSQQNISNPAHISFSCCSSDMLCSSRPPVKKLIHTPPWMLFGSALQLWLW